MTVPLKYAHRYMPVKYFLTSYRALSDGRSGIRHLEELLAGSSILLSEWKVVWLGTCTVLRTAIDLFRVDAKSCISPRIREEVSAEWKAIGDDKPAHALFWDFLKHERDNVIHEYQWRAYEMWIDAEGNAQQPKLSLLSLRPEDSRSVLLMKSGAYAGRDSLELLKESAEWVEARIFDAIRRAGFDPEEHRNLVRFTPRPSLRGGLLSGETTQP